MRSVNDTANCTYVHRIESFSQFINEDKVVIDSSESLDLAVFKDSDDTAKIDVMLVNMSIKLIQYRMEYYNNITSNQDGIKQITTVLIIIHCVAIRCFVVYFCRVCFSKSYTILG